MTTPEDRIRRAVARFMRQISGRREPIALTKGQLHLLAAGLDDDLDLIDADPEFLPEPHRWTSDVHAAIRTADEQALATFEQRAANSFASRLTAIGAHPVDELTRQPDGTTRYADNAGAITRSHLRQLARCLLAERVPPRPRQATSNGTFDQRVRRVVEQILDERAATHAKGVQN